MAGAKPKPTRLKVLAGNPGKRKLPKNEPQPVAFLKDAPDWFTKGQLEYWDYALASAPPGLLGTMDRDVLVIWVVAAVLHRDAVKALAEEDGMLHTTPNGLLQQSAHIPIINKQALLMLRAASELGFTPSSRSKIDLGKTGGKSGEFDKF
jgi:P27 family predicted phage terminase small subunit